MTFGRFTVCLLRSECESDFDTFVGLFVEFIYKMIAVFSALILSVKHHFCSFQIWMQSDWVCQLVARHSSMVTISKYAKFFV